MPMTETFDYLNFYLPIDTLQLFLQFLENCYAYTHIPYGANIELYIFHPRQMRSFFKLHFMVKSRCDKEKHFNYSTYQCLVTLTPGNAITLLEATQLVTVVFIV